MTIAKIALPSITPETFQFEFTVTLSEGSATFTFKWLNDMWNLFVTFPNTTVREAGVFPEAASWLGFSDYRLLFLSAYDKIDRNNIGEASMYLLDMKNE